MDSFCLDTIYYTRHQRKQINTYIVENNTMNVTEVKYFDYIHHRMH